MLNPFAALYIAMGLSLRRRGRESDAISYVEKAFKAYRVEGPSERAPVLLNAFYADLCERTGATDTAYDAARIVVIQINEINEGVRRGGPRKAENQWFILYWMKNVLSRSSLHLDSEAWDLALAIPATYSSLNLPKTSSLLKDMFFFEHEWAITFDQAVDQARRDLAG